MNLLATTRFHDEFESNGKLIHFLMIEKKLQFFWSVNSKNGFALEILRRDQLLEFRLFKLQLLTILDQSGTFQSSRLFLSFQRSCSELEDKLFN